MQPNLLRPIALIKILNRHLSHFRLRSLIITIVKFVDKFNPTKLVRIFGRFFQPKISFGLIQKRNKSFQSCAKFQTNIHDSLVADRVKCRKCRKSIAALKYNSRGILLLVIYASRVFVKGQVRSKLCYQNQVLHTACQLTLRDNKLYFLKSKCEGFFLSLSYTKGETKQSNRQWLWLSW